MEETQVSRVRRFNRLVTQRVGALDDSYLARDRSLGEARLLWEIDAEGRDVRDLRIALDLDSGYVSRLLRSLELSGLVTVESKDADRRVRVARLTPEGRVERDLLDKRSDALAGSFLQHLSEGQRTRLVDAMTEVERLLTAATVEVVVRDPGHRQARYCLGEYFSELDRRFEAGFDVERSIPADEHALRPPAGALLIATLRDEPVGCAALKRHGDAPGEVKRMWVAGSVRGLGVGRRLLAEVESYAVDHGVAVLRLETNRSLVEAISLYRSAGYVEVAAFNAEPYAHHWFEKTITRGDGGARSRRGDVRRRSSTTSTPS